MTALTQKEIDIRDFFAAAAMQGLLSSAKDFAGTPEDLAAMAYEQADAMMAMRAAGERGD